MDVKQLLHAFKLHGIKLASLTFDSDKGAVLSIQGETPVTISPYGITMEPFSFLVTNEDFVSAGLAGYEMVPCPMCQTDSHAQCIRWMTGAACACPVCKVAIMSPELK